CTSIIHEWRINGITILALNGDKISYDKFKDLDELYCRITCNDSCPSPKDTVSNIIVFHVTPAFISKLNNSVNNFQLYPNPNNGNFMLTGEDIEGDLDLEILDMVGRPVYREALYSRSKLNRK